MALTPDQQALVLTATRVLLAEVSRFCRKHGTRAYAQQDDLTQCAWERLCVAAPLFEGRCKFTTYAVRSVRGALAREFFERRGKEDAKESMDDYPVADSNLDDRLDGAFLGRELRRQFIATESRGGRSTLPMPYDKAARNADAFVANLIGDPTGIPKASLHKVKQRGTRILDNMMCL